MKFLQWKRNVFFLRKKTPQNIFARHYCTVSFVYMLNIFHEMNSIAKRIGEYKKNDYTKNEYTNKFHSITERHMEIGQYYWTVELSKPQAHAHLYVMNM